MHSPWIRLTDRYYVQIVSGWMGATGGGTRNPLAVPLTASVLDRDNAFLPVAVFHSEDRSGRRKLWRTVRLARADCKRRNDNETAWEKAHGIPPTIRFEHGASGYNNHGCRCWVCTRGKRVQMRERRALGLR